MDKVSKVMTIIAGVLLVAALAMSVLWGGFGADESENTAVEDTIPVIPPEPVRISIVSATDYIATEHTAKISVTGSQTGLAYMSMDPAVAQVNEHGEVTGIAPGKTTIIISGENVVPIGYELTVIRKGLVFLSPSRQYGNPYAAGDTDEGTQMHRVAEACEQKLRNAGLEVYICPDEYELEDRGELAAQMNSLCYVAIHSNAAPNQEGTSAYFHNRMPESMALALAVFDTVAELTPTTDGLGLVNGMAKDNGFGYKEIRFPGLAGVPSTLLEVEFHDKEPLAQWIIDNADPLGIAVADGILTYLERLK